MRASEGLSKVLVKPSKIGEEPVVFVGFQMRFNQCVSRAFRGIAAVFQGLQSFIWVAGAFQGDLEGSRGLTGGFRGSPGALMGFLIRSRGFRGVLRYSSGTLLRMPEDFNRGFGQFHRRFSNLHGVSGSLQGLLSNSSAVYGDQWVLSSSRRFQWGSSGLTQVTHMSQKSNGSTSLGCIKVTVTQYQKAVTVTSTQPKFSLSQLLYNI